MQSGVHLGFEGIHQLLCYMTVLYFLHFYFKTFFITAENIFISIAGLLIIFEFSNELHLTPFIYQKSNYEIKKLKKYHSLT